METDFKDPERINEAMKGGLARMYADADFRDYLVHLVNVYNHNTLSAVRAGKIELSRDYTAKLDATKKLLENGKAMYTQSEKLRSTPLQEQINQQDAANKEQV